MLFIILLKMFQISIENEISNSKLSLEQQAKNMNFRSINKFPPCNVGNTVRVKLPEVDRNKGDPQNVFFAVVSVVLVIINITNSVIKMAFFINFIPEINLLYVLNH